MNVRLCRPDSRLVVSERPRYACVAVYKWTVVEDTARRGAAYGTHAGDHFKNLTVEYHDGYRFEDGHLAGHYHNPPKPVVDHLRELGVTVCLDPDRNTEVIA
jgi:hypothetical protein